MLFKVSLRFLSIVIILIKAFVLLRPPPYEPRQACTTLHIGQLWGDNGKGKPVLKHMPKWLGKDMLC